MGIIKLVGVVVEDSAHRKVLHSLIVILVMVKELDCPNNLSMRVQIMAF